MSSMILDDSVIFVRAIDSQCLVCLIAAQVLTVTIGFAIMYFVFVYISYLYYTIIDVILYFLFVYICYLYYSLGHVT